jgi:alpha-L-fucosidase
MDRINGMAMLLLVLALCAGALGQKPSGDSDAWFETEADRDARMAWWREARFGMFIHWGLYAIPAGEWGDETRYGEWIMNNAQIPVETYEQFVPQFNPVDFDADEWVLAAKDAGLRYIVITTKHHDGFCLFDSKHTDYDIMSTPFRRDIMSELAGACRRHGMRLGWYHSIMDWHHPDYLPRRGWEDRSDEDADYERYVAYMRDQVTELLTEYGDIAVMWFDGQWEGTWTHEHGQALYELCRQLQPAVIVNNRVDKGSSLGRHPKYRGDYGTPEQHIPDTGLPGADWETCMTMNRHWGYNARDDDYKSTTTLIRNLIDIASKGGNYLLNVGPMADGRFPAMSVERLREIGDWMDVNGASIYGTQASPLEAPSWGRCTARMQDGRTTVYLHVFDWPQDGALRLANLGSDVERACMLADPRMSLRVIREGHMTSIKVPRKAPDEHATVIALDIVGEPIVYRTPTIDAPADIFVSAMIVSIDGGHPMIDVRYTLDGTEPTSRSPRYEQPIEIDETTVVRAVALHRDEVVSEIVTRRFERVEPMPAVDVHPAGSGLRLEIYEGNWDTMPDFDGLEPVEVGVASSVSLPSGATAEYQGRRMNGYLAVGHDDVYIFELESDDGSILTIDGIVVVDNDGLHGSKALRGAIPLEAGRHAIEVEYFNKTGGATLYLRMGRAGGPISLVAPNVLTHAP